jgi:hypothetical protein
MVKSMGNVPCRVILLGTVLVELTTWECQRIVTLVKEEMIMMKEETINTYGLMWPSVTNNQAYLGCCVTPSNYTPGYITERACREELLDLNCYSA